MTETERLLAEAIGNMFRNKESNLGIVTHKEHNHILQYEREMVEDMFALKCAESAFHEDLCGAFRDIHSYRYLDDPNFPVSFEKRLTARGIPTEEIKSGIKYISEIAKELGGENYQEKHAGWHPNIKEIADMTRNANDRTPSKEPPYTGGGPAPSKNELTQEKQQEAIA